MKNNNCNVYIPKHNIIALLCNFKFSKSNSMNTKHQAPNPLTQSLNPPLTPRHPPPTSSPSSSPHSTP